MANNNKWASAKAKAFREGYNANQYARNPYLRGTVQAKAWDAGYAQATAERLRRQHLVQRRQVRQVAWITGAALAAGLIVWRLL